MKGKFQGENELTIKASVDVIWNILIDGKLLPQWVTVVKHTTSEVESLNAVRYCDVEMNGKTGKVSEKCILYNEKKEIGWLMLSDEFGISKLYENYSFSFELVPIDKDLTKIIARGYSDPKNLYAKTLNILVMRKMARKMRNHELLAIQKLVENN